MKMVEARVWDLPTRIFHWTLLASVAAAYGTGFVGGNAMVWHGRIGLAIVALVAFRLVWGLVGSTHARFADFLPTPARVRAYLQGRWQGLGHNPLGAFSVLGLLAVVAFQVGSGLIGTDDIAFNGPLYALVSSDFSETATSLHRLSIWVLGGLIGLHVLAIVFYARFKRHNLVPAMITGTRLVPEVQARPVKGGGVLALVLALAIAAGATYAAAGGLLAPPPPPAATPAW